MAEVGTSSLSGDFDSVTAYTAYSCLGPVTASSQTTNGQAYTVSYAYNLADSLTSETYPSGRIVTTTYDGANRTSELSGKLNSTTHTYLTMPGSGASPPYGYGAQGDFASLPLGNGLTRTFSFNSRLQTIGITDSNGGSHALWAATLLGWGTTTNNGNLLSANYTTSQTGSSSGPYFNQSFGYDNVNRLKAASETGSGTGWTQDYGFDAYGNIWKTTSSNTPPDSIPTAQSAYVATTNQLTSPDSYDSSGNQLTISGAGTGYTVTAAYDAESRQITATDSGGLGGGTAYYWYDGDGHRVVKTLPSGSTFYVYDAMGLMAAEYDLVPFGPAPCSTCYISWDHLGSTRMITGPSASSGAVSYHDYMPFAIEIPSGYDGRTSSWGGTDDVNQKFTSKERDLETGLDYFGARYFSGAQGRFTSPDPLMGSAQIANPQTWNRYSYGLNNPLTNTDPFGLYDWDCSAGCNLPDDELRKRAADKDSSRAERNWAKNSLAFREKFREGLASATDAAGASGQASAQEAVSAYGNENDHNGVFVGVNPNVSGSSATTRLLGDDNISVSFNEGLGGGTLAVVAAHEGRHVADAQAWVGAGEPAGSPLDLSHYFREDRAWQVSSYIAAALGLRSFAPRGGGTDYQVWNRGWKAVDRDALRSKGIQNILRYSGLSPSDKDTYSSEHPEH